MSSRPTDEGNGQHLGASSSVVVIALRFFDRLSSPARDDALLAALPDPPAEIRTAAICVITYRRPELLFRLLTSLGGQQTGRALRVVVVDNDPAASARDTAGQFAGVTYVVQPKPGIPAARNACLDQLESDDDAIIFVDDDEWVPPEWADRLCIEAQLRRVHIVGGPVVTVFPDDIPGWVRRGGFFQRHVRPSGSTGGSPYTGNALVTTSLLRWRGTRFDEEGFADSGGSDTDFFNRLALAHGVPWYWCAEAPAYEDLPPERVSLRWVLRRGLRGGNVAGRIQLRTSPVWQVALAGVISALLGSLALPVAAIVQPRSTSAAVGLMTRGVGMLGAVNGRIVHEYRRPPR